MIVKNYLNMAVYLGIRRTPQEFERLKLENVDFNVKVDAMKEEVSKKTNLSKNVLEFIYCGNILNDEMSLSQCGIKPGVMIHVLQKSIDAEVIIPSIPTDAEIILFQKYLASVTSTLKTRLAFMKIGRPEILDKIVEKTPGLVDDPVAISMIRDPILLLNLTDFETAKKVAALHPTIISALPNIKTCVKDQSTVTNPSQPGTNSGYSYTLEALLNDEDPESSGSDSGQPGTSNTTNRRQRPSTITANQLAAALAYVNNSQPTTPTAYSRNPFLSYTPQNSQPRTTESENANGVITTSMFSNALSQALNPERPSPSSSDNNSTRSDQDQRVTSTPSMDPRVMVRSMAPQMQSMREMGLTNDGINLQALVISNGDVQAAINLVFSGAMGSN